MLDNSEEVMNKFFEDESYEGKYVFLCASIYHVYIAIMLILKEQIEDRTILLLTTHETAQHEHFVRILPEITKLGIYSETRLRNKKMELLGVEAAKTNLQYKRLRIKYGLEQYRLINFSWNFSGPFRTASFWYNNASLILFFEEGAMCYATPQDKPYKRFLKKLCGICTNFCEDNRLVAIFVQELSFFPERLQKKMKILNIKGIANSVPNDVKKKYYLFFLVQLEIDYLNQWKRVTSLSFIRSL